ncbi:MAG: ribonuclease PH, partial [Acidobacteria bacterium]|nr:ribonuclease PH [Acidobacteriota bacterium]
MRAGSGTFAGRCGRRSRVSRRGGRGEREIRDLGFQAGYLRRAPGSVLVRQGDTRVVAAVSVEEGVPGWLRGRG